MTRVNILTDEQYQLLAFIAACNRSSYNPTEQEVMLWWDNPGPAEAEYRTVAVPSVLPDSLFNSYQGLGGDVSALFSGSNSLSKMFETMINDQSGWITRLGRPSTRKEMVKPAETTIEHLVRLTWLEDVGDDQSPGLRLTEIGRALLRDHEQDSAAHEDVSVVVFEPEDPLAYPLLVGQLANAGKGLLVDPYLKVGDLHRIAVSTQLTRLLVTGGPQNKRELAAIQTFLDSPRLDRRVEVRSSKDLHDRVLVAEDGSVLTLGTSLNGVGRKLTVLSPIPPPRHTVFRAAYEEIWNRAELVGPTPSEDEPDDDAEHDDPDTPPQSKQ